MDMRLGSSPPALFLVILALVVGSCLTLLAASSSAGGCLACTGLFSCIVLLRFRSSLQITYRN